MEAFGQQGVPNELRPFIDCSKPSLRTVEMKTVQFQWHMLFISRIRVTMCIHLRNTSSAINILSMSVDT
jgi:hypothetical protein